MISFFTKNFNFKDCDQIKLTSLNQMNHCKRVKLFYHYKTNNIPYLPKDTISSSMAQSQRDSLKTKNKHHQPYFNQYSMKSNQNTISLNKLKYTSHLVILLEKVINKLLVNESFQSIHRLTSSLKNKELIYSAIYKNSTTQKKNPQTARKKIQETRIQTIKKQKLEELPFDNDDISTIIIDRSQDNTISNHSRLYLEDILGIDSLNTNKFVTFKPKIHHQFVNENKLLTETLKKKSGIPKNFQLQQKQKSFLCKNLAFQFQQNRSNFQHDKSPNIKYHKRFQYNAFKTKQTQNSRVHQIYIVREPSIKSNRAYSQPIKMKTTYISLPLKSRKIQVTEFFGIHKKQARSSQSLNSKNCTITCETTSIEQKCKHCSMVERSFEMLKKLRQSNS